MSVDELKKELHSFRIDDKWGIHNYSSRILVVTLAITILSLTAGVLLGYSIHQDIMVAAFWSATATIITYGLGPSAVDKATDLVGKLKGFK